MSDGTTTGNVHVLISGKNEGFHWKDADVFIGSEFDVEARINRLRPQGYRIFIVTQEIARVDDIADAARLREASE
jgi:hypothetical protein